MGPTVVARMVSNQSDGVGGGWEWGGWGCKLSLSECLKFHTTTGPKLCVNY